MGLEKALVCFFLIIILIPPAQGRDYQIPDAITIVDVNEQGLVHVQETLVFRLKGEYKELFRNIYTPVDGRIDNIKVSCQPLPCESRITEINGGYELVGVLPQPNPEDLSFSISYDVYGGVRVYNDVSELHMKLWGDDWEKSLGGLYSEITLPVSDEEIKYWLHPGSFVKGHSKEGPTIRIDARDIPAKSWFEIRAVFPRIIEPDPEIVSIQHVDGLQGISDMEEDYEVRSSKVGKLNIITWLVAAIGLSAPLLIYYVFGREPKVDYTSIYERELPYRSKPAVVNAIMEGKVGTPDPKGFLGTVMDLANRGFIDIGEDEDELFLRIKNKGDKKLYDFERFVLQFLGLYSHEGLIRWKQLKERLGRDDRFYRFIEKWKRHVKGHIKVERIFNSKGNHILMAYGLGAVILSLLIGYVLSSNYPLKAYPEVRKAILPGGIFFLSGVAALAASIINERGAGRFTPEGRLYFLRWKRFKKYLTDFSALKDHPPSSLRLWDHYLVYAVALGVAEEALKNMSLIVGKEDFASTSFHLLNEQPDFFRGLYNAYDKSNPTSQMSGSGGIGGVGGGFGGGGGGAR